MSKKDRRKEILKELDGIDTDIILIAFNEQGGVLDKFVEDEFLKMRPHELEDFVTYVKIRNKLLMIARNG